MNKTPEQDLKDKKMIEEWLKKNKPKVAKDVQEKGYTGLKIGGRNE